MSQEELLFGLILLAVAVGCHLARKRAQKRLARMQSVETSSVEHLKALAASMAEGMGEEGLLAFATEVRGTVRAAEPLQAELSGEPCIHFRFRVSREYEETYWESDSQGRRRQRTRRGSETVSENERSIPFELDDGTGRVRVDPAGAEIIPTTALSDFRPDDGRGGDLEIGGLRLPVARSTGGRRTVGYRFEEQIIPVGREIYVLGEASDAAGTLTVGRPADGSQFLVSTKGEAQVGSSRVDLQACKLEYSIVSPK